MAEAKAGKGAGPDQGKAKVLTPKRRTSSASSPTKKSPPKATVKQLAKDWDQVT